MTLQDQIDRLATELEITQIQKVSHFDAGRSSTDPIIRKKEIDVAKSLQQEELAMIEKLKKLAAERDES